MAIVPNKDGQGIKANGFYGDIDRSYNTPNRFVASNPNGVTSPYYTGEIVMTTADGGTFQALSMANNTWAWRDV